MVSHAYLGLSLSSVPKESLDRAVTVARSAEGYIFREAGCCLAWLRRFWLGRNKVSRLKAGGAPSCRTASRIDRVVCAIQDITGWLLSISETAPHHFSGPLAQHSAGHGDVVFMGLEVSKPCQAGLFWAILCLTQHLPHSGAPLAPPAGFRSIH